MKRIIAFGLVLLFLASCAFSNSIAIKSSKKRAVQQNKIQYKGTRK